MGVSTNVYVYYGIKIDFNNELNDAFEDYWENNRENLLPDHVFDSMTGEYMVLGSRLYNGGDMRYGCEDADGFTTLDLDKLDGMETEYKQEFCTLFPQFADLINQPFEILMFTHWS